MIRFIPDDLWQALLRPLAMAVPAGNVYVEIIAPDFRFLLFFLFLFFAWAFRGNGEKLPDPHGRALVAYFFVAYILWLASSGNGRYMLPIFLLIGPAIVWLATRLTVSRHVKLSVVAITLASQACIVYLSDPLATWKQADWKLPNGFDFEIDPSLAGLQATYVTDKMPTFSILAPRFNPQSRWMNLSAFDSAAVEKTKKIHEILKSSSNIRWVTLATPKSASNAYPTVEQLIVLNRSMSLWGLNVRVASDCSFAKSTSVEPRTPLLLVVDGVSQKLWPTGFWICTAHYDANSLVKHEPLTNDVLAAIATVEKSCMRFFPAGRGVRVDFSDPVRIRYPDTDMMLYVYPHGEVSYVYYNSLNSVKIGMVKEIASGKVAPSCTRIPARERMPWN